MQRAASPYQLLMLKNKKPPSPKRAPTRLLKSNQLSAPKKKVKKSSSPNDIPADKVGADSRPARIKKKKVPSETSRQLATLKKTVVESNSRRISKLKSKGMRSIIGDSVDQIQHLLEVGSNESALSLIQKRLLQSVIDVLPFAENSIRNTEGQRGVYQFNSLITSMRELMIDMQSTRDKGAIGAELIERVLRPAFMDLAMTLVQEEARFANAIGDKLSTENYRIARELNKELISRVAEAIKEKYGEAKAQAISFLQG